MSVKEFPGKPTVYVGSTDTGVEVTTDKHMRYANMPLKNILQEICEAALQHANEIFSKYDYPNGEWFPCGSADIVLRWNQHREVIDLFRKEATEKSQDYWCGWFGKLHKTSSQGWWWFPNLDKASQSMRYEEEVCRFIRDRLAYANIRVEIRTYID